MKQTIILSVPRSSTASQLRRAVSAIFAETPSLIIAAIGAVVTFVAGVAMEDETAVAITAMVSLPWIIRSLYTGSEEGGRA